MLAALAPNIGGLLAEPIGWRGIYWVLVGLHVVVLVALFFCVAPTGFIMGNSAALATGLRRDKAGSVSAVMGGVQSLLGGLVSPLMGLGSDRLLTMSLGMCVCAGVAAAAAFAATRCHVGE